MARAIDAEKYMELLKEQYLHHKSMGDSQAARAWQGAMQLLYDMPTLTPPEIVCCQDCVHHEDGYAHWCHKWEHARPDDSEFFCKYGRKKNDSTTD